MDRKELVKLILKDTEALKYKADARGVTAWAEKPIHRARPNNTFLSNTLRSVARANRVETSADERSVRKRAACPESRADYCVGKSSSKVRSTEGSKKGSNARKGDSTSESSQPETDDSTSEDTRPEMDDFELDEFLARKRSRGRGAHGSRAEEPGPYLPPEMRERQIREALHAARNEPPVRHFGPARPIQHLSARLPSADYNTRRACSTQKDRLAGDSAGNEVRRHSFGGSRQAVRSEDTQSAGIAARDKEKKKDKKTHKERKQRKKEKKRKRER
ncbi:hypothetical protein CYMTET_13033 [Cymbomonas tetramitiformis]|uniref:Uncharacterized protein n=1 Tax=Cymbomonas tetramitiformis TaxID=36881 RepID=A0AAE0LBT6_9CHLO|nr:hypothetical protein CYMTET_13033 [Cymbomonas tetramitiformis]